MTLKSIPQINVCCSFVVILAVKITKNNNISNTSSCITTVHFIKVCQRLFGDNFFITCFFRTETFMMCVNVFYTTRNEISAGSSKKQRFSPQTPIIKIGHFCNVMSIDMTLQKWAIFIMGVYGEISHFMSDQAAISFLVV